MALVPGLEERLNTTSNDEVIYIADMVSNIISIPERCGLDLTLSTDYQGCFIRQIGRYEDTQVRCHRLDHPGKWISYAAPFTQHQDGPWFLP